MFEIYFSDLILEVQSELLTAAGITKPEEANWDLFPIAVIEPEYLTQFAKEEMAEMKEMQILMEDFGLIK